MPQYQSFPDAAGDSATLEKLKALRLPQMVGKRFLDVGCNEGFFCGFAKFAGASEVVGIDQAEHFIVRARERFPNVQFIQQSWDVLPEGQFDVILLASALHYAPDQAQLIERLMAALAPDGVLVLELGIAVGAENEWVEVERGIDRRLFPTYAKLESLLQSYAWKEIGQSVAQTGDPVPRWVYHISRRKPFAYLLMQPPGFGKSNVCRKLFRPAQVRIISNDNCMMRIARRELAADPALLAFLPADVSSQNLDIHLLALLDAGLLSHLVQVWLAQAQGEDFALDAYLPAIYHAQVAQLLQAQAYVAIQFNWARPGGPLRATQAIQDQADAFYTHLQSSSSLHEVVPALCLPFTGTKGHLDQIRWINDELRFFGWAVHENGHMPEILRIELDGQSYLFHGYERNRRPDVQAVYALPHEMLGFCLTVRAPQTISAEQLPNLVKVFGGNEVGSLMGPFGIDRKNGLKVVV